MEQPAWAPGLKALVRRHRYDFAAAAAPLPVDNDVIFNIASQEQAIFYAEARKEVASVETRLAEDEGAARTKQELETLAKEHGVTRWTTDLDGAIANADDTLFFDSASTNLRAELLRKAIDAGKDLYCEKPSAGTLKDAIDVYQRAEKAGVRHGVVQDKIFLPGLQKMKQLMDDGFFGRLLSVKIDFGYWVFEGDWKQAQRPSWNYRKEDGGGIILDMMPHWRYVLDNTFGSVKSVSCLGRVNIDKRWDENDEAYDADADDASYALVELAGGAVAQIFASWCTRVRKDDLVTFHADGTHGAAVAGLT